MRVSGYRGFVPITVAWAVPDLNRVPLVSLAYSYFIFSVLFNLARVSSGVYLLISPQATSAHISFHFATVIYP
jgi:hypothetical protein